MIQYNYSIDSFLFCSEINELAIRISVNAPIAVAVVSIKSAIKVIFLLFGRSPRCKEIHASYRQICPFRHQPDDRHCLGDGEYHRYFFFGNCCKTRRRLCCLRYFSSVPARQKENRRRYNTGNGMRFPMRRDVRDRITIWMPL